MVRLGGVLVGVLPVLGAAAGAGPGHDDADLRWWDDASRPAYVEHERALLAVPETDRLRAWHEMLAGEVHDAGSPGDLALIESAAEAFEAMGLEVEVHWFDAYLARPVEAYLAIASPEQIVLPVTEAPVPGDSYAAPPHLSPGWNAYAGSGDVTASVVYANYGTKGDFERLAELGVSCEGKIVIARYGRLYRGHKARFAEAAGAAGLVMFTDPRDSGFGRGLVYPAGGFANSTHIQRGSIKTLGYPGDPLTPFIEASADAPRLDPDDVALPTIPVQPIGYAAASQILERMGGPEAPSDWQGGLALRYRLGAEDDGLTVHIAVEQERGLVRTANVVATLRGATEPGRRIVIGCHHDAWGYGAGDPAAGGMALMEAARAMAERAAAGTPPARTVQFALWGAEEHGIIGSVEWVESRADTLFRECVAYLNLDMAAMGPRFGSSASPSLRRVIAEATAAVPQVGDAERSVREVWGGEDGLGRFGDLGGGSDHIGFWCHLGVPSASIGGRGSRGESYHSLYDNLDWYRAVVGEDYEPALMVTRMTLAVASRLANAPLLPLDPAAAHEQAVGHIERLAGRGRALDVFAGDDERMPAGLARLHGIAREHAEMLDGAREVARGDVRRHARAWNDAVISAARAWVLPDGLPGRPWFRNLYAATDPDSGYGAWMLPGLRGAIEARDTQMLALMRAACAEAMDASAAPFGAMASDR